MSRIYFLLYSIGNSLLYISHWFTLSLSLSLTIIYYYLLLKLLFVVMIIICYYDYDYYYYYYSGFDQRFNGIMNHN